MLGGTLLVTVLMAGMARSSLQAEREANRRSREREARQQAERIAEEKTRTLQETLEEVRETSRRLREAQEVAQLGSWEWDVDPDVVQWSDQVYRLYGLGVGEPEDPSFEAFLESVHPDDREGIRRKVESALETGEYPTTTWRTNPERGSVRWVEDRGEVVEEDGEVVGLRGTVQDVTERKRMEERLEEAQRVAGTGHWVWDLETDDVSWSQALYDLFERDPESLDPDVGTFLDLLHPDDREEVEGILEEAVESGEFPTFSYRVLLPDGRVRWMESRGRFRTVDGEVVEATGTVTDVHDRKMLQERLQEAQEVADVGMFERDVRTGEGLWSPVFHRLLGYDPEETDTDLPRFLDRVHPEDEQEVEEVAQAAMERGEETDLEIRYVRPGGETRHGDLRVRAQTGADGEVLRVYGTLQDVTGQRKLERRLEEAQRMTGLGTFRRTPDFEEVEWSDEMYRILGVDPDEFDVDQDTLDDVIHPEDRPTVERIREEVRETGEAEDVFRVVRHDGEVRHVEARVRADAPKGEVKAIYGTLLDITDRKRLIDELEEAKEAAEAADQAKSRFLANTSHEIRTPMNAVMGFTDLLLDTDLDARQRSYVETVRNSGDHLLAILNDILDLSKIEAGKLTLVEEPFDLREVVETSLDLLAPRAGEKDLDLIYEYGGEVPETIHGDRARLKQVLVNLVSNAVKFTDEGQVVARASVGADLGDEGIELVLEVEDTGPGIPDDEVEAIFDPFAQEDATATRQQEGTGLGLAICQRLVDLMGGRMDLETEVGEGSTFRITIPVDPGDVAPERAWKARPGDLVGKRVLVVDDNEANRSLVVEHVRRWGMDPVEAGGGEEALERLGEDGFDLVLLDQQMPGMSGVEIVDGIRDDLGDGDLPVVLMPSVPEVAGRVERDDVRVSEVVVKPVEPSDLFAACRRALGTLEAEPEDEGRRFDRDLGKRLDLDVVVAEDNEVNRQVITLMLENLGVEARKTVNGAEAVEAVRADGCDVVLMDVQMPEMDGLEATETIRREVPAEDQPRIVALTAHASDEDRTRCLEAGMDGYMSKPVQVEELVEALSKAV